jgi:hypothetical protein
MLKFDDLSWKMKDLSGFVNVRLNENLKLSIVLRERERWNSAKSEYHLIFRDVIEIFCWGFEI